MELNHMIVPAHDNEASALFYADVFGLEYKGPLGHFAPIQIPNQGLTLDFDTDEAFYPQHYAFKVTEKEFDEIFGRIKDLNLTYGSEPL